MPEIKKPGAGKAPARDILVVGGSSGALEVVLRLAKDVPDDLHASIFVAIHTASRESTLPDLLNRDGKLPAALASDRERIRPGRIYVAPPDRHLLLEDGVLRVSTGPRENGFRPSVDALFRTAARVYGERVAGVVLSGALDCGSSGLRVIRSVGGAAVVQDPATAQVPEMPDNALKSSGADHVASPEELGPLLRALALGERPPGSWAANAKPRVRGAKAAHAGQPDRAEHSDLTCPECHGALVERREESNVTFSCHIGHVFSLIGLDAEKTRDLEGALWSSVRILRENAALASRLGAGRGDELSRRFHERAAALMRHSMLIEGLLLRSDVLVPPPPPRPPAEAQPMQRQIEELHRRARAPGGSPSAKRSDARRFKGAPPGRHRARKSAGYPVR